jgi:hypothetical protein
MSTAVLVAVVAADRARGRVVACSVIIAPLSPLIQACWFACCFAAAAAAALFLFLLFLLLLFLFFALFVSQTRKRQS